MENMTQTVGEAAVEVEVTVPVVPATILTTIDDAINRLSEIQDAERNLAKEKDSLRKGVEFAMRREGVGQHVTADGHTATLYSQTRRSVDFDLLKSILSPADFARAVSEGTSTGMRIR